MHQFESSLFLQIGQIDSVCFTIEEVLTPLQDVEAPHIAVLEHDAKVIYRVPVDITQSVDAERHVIRSNFGVDDSHHPFPLVPNGYFFDVEFVHLVSYSPYGFTDAIFLASRDDVERLGACSQRYVFLAISVHVHHFALPCLLPYMLE